LTQTPVRLPKAFYRLPLRFDVDRLRTEAAELPADAWSPHPNGDAGNTRESRGGVCRSRLLRLAPGANVPVHAIFTITGSIAYGFISPF
jgi:hypothetical protein